MKQGEIWLINLDLFKDSSADCFQIRSVSQERFISKIGKVSDSVLDEIKIGLTKVLSIWNDYRITGFTTTVRRTLRGTVKKSRFPDMRAALIIQPILNYNQLFFFLIYSK